MFKSYVLNWGANRVLVTVDWLELRGLAFERLFGNIWSGCFFWKLNFFLFVGVTGQVGIVGGVELILG